MSKQFQDKVKALYESYVEFLKTPNEKQEYSNGVYNRFTNPVLTARHIPLTWRYDFNEKSNPFLMERIGYNAVFNTGAIKLDGKFLLVTRVEGINRKSFFAVAESNNGIDNFKFWDYPVVMPETEDPDVNIYDMRLIQHEDGWIYGLFCTERKDPKALPGDESAAIAQCGIARTKDLINWERLSDLKTHSPQQRNVVLHPEFVNGKYAFYTRPQDGFIDAGKRGGIGFGLSSSIEDAFIDEELILDAKKYHTVSEVKNGLGPAPLKTKYGWLHLAHGVRNTAAGLRYVLYMFMTDLQNPMKVIYKPAGYFIAPENNERIGDVSNVVFSNGWILDDDGTVYIYYASSDTRIHVAVSTIEKLIDYTINTPSDGYTSANTVKQINKLINSNVNYFSLYNLNGIKEAAN